LFQSPFFYIVKLNKLLSCHPLYRLLAGFEKICVGFGEMLAAEETGVSGVGGGVGGFEDKVLTGVYQTFFFLGEFAPEEENDVFFFVGKGFDGGVGEFFPTEIAVRSWRTSADGQNGVE